MCLVAKVLVGFIGSTLAFGSSDCGSNLGEGENLSSLIFLLMPLTFDLLKDKVSDMNTLVDSL